MANPAKMRAVVGPVVALTAVVGLAVAVSYATNAEHRLSPTGPLVHREPFDVPRLLENGRLGGRPVTFEELQQKIRTSWQGAANNSDLPNLVAIDPKRGFAAAEEVLRTKRAGTGGTPLQTWDSILASLNDDWALRAREEIYGIRLGSGYEPKVPDPVLIPGQDHFSYGSQDFAMGLYEGRTGHNPFQYKEVAPPLGAPKITRPKPKDRLSRIASGWRTSADVDRAFDEARRAGEAELLARKAYGVFADGDLKPGLLPALGALARRNPGTFAGTPIGWVTSEEAPLGKRVGNFANLHWLVDLAPIAASARVAELRNETLRSLREDEHLPAISAGANLLKLLPADAELRKAVRDARWRERQILPLVAEGDKEALAFAAKWASDGNPAHECDGALLAQYPQADAITAPLHRSRASRCRALLLDGYRRRSDPEATRRIRLLLKDPSPRVRLAARKILEVRTLTIAAKARAKR